jgi:hypothetical protein
MRCPARPACRACSGHTGRAPAWERCSLPDLASRHPAQSPCSRTSTGDAYPPQNGWWSSRLPRCASASGGSKRQEADPPARDHGSAGPADTVATQPGIGPGLRNWFDLGLSFWMPLARAAYGRLPEWPKGAVCKTVGSAYDGSNPSPATTCGNGPLTSKNTVRGSFRLVRSYAASGGAVQVLTPNTRRNLGEHPTTYRRSQEPRWSRLRGRDRQRMCQLRLVRWLRGCAVWLRPADLRCTWRRRGAARLCCGPPIRRPGPGVPRR